MPISPATRTKALHYSYDGLHRRILRQIREWTGSSWINLDTTRFLYEAWNVVEEHKVIGSTQTLARARTWGSDLSGSLQGAGGVGGLLLTEEFTGSSTAAYHHHYDGNGNVTEITDLAGTTAARYRYDAFGNTLVSTGSYASENRYRFSTKPLDAEVPNAPLYYYDPVTGRWPSRDPIEEEGGINLYGFVGNNGVNLWDVLGLKDCGCKADGSGPIEEVEDSRGNKCCPSEIGMGGKDNLEKICGAKQEEEEDDEGGGGGGNSCFNRCMSQSGGYAALAAFGAARVGGGTVPSKGFFGPAAAGGGQSGRYLTTVPSMAATLLGGAKESTKMGRFARNLRTFGRKFNPVARIVQAASGGYAAGVAASCAANCAINPNFF